MQQKGNLIQSESQNRHLPIKSSSTLATIDVIQVICPLLNYVSDLFFSTSLLFLPLLFVKTTLLFLKNSFPSDSKNVICPQESILPRPGTQATITFKPGSQAERISPNTDKTIPFHRRFFKLFWELRIQGFLIYINLDTCCLEHLMLNYRCQKRIGLTQKGNYKDLLSIISLSLNKDPEN